MTIKFFNTFLLLLMFIFSCTTGYKKLKYPDEYPSEIISSMENVEKKVDEFYKHKNDSIKKLPTKMNLDNRSKASIMRTVMQNLAKLQYEYNRRLRKRPDLYGKISITFSILETGKVNSAKVTYSTIKDDILEKAIRDSVLNWKFEKLGIEKDTTQVTYPFVFTSSQSHQDVWDLDAEETKKGDRPINEVTKTIENLKDNLLPYINSDKKLRGVKHRNLGIRLSIREDGFVQSVDIKKPTLESPAVEVEVLREIMKWVFPKCKTCVGITNIEYTLRF